MSTEDSLKKASLSSKEYINEKSGVKIDIVKLFRDAAASPGRDPHEERKLKVAKKIAKIVNKHEKPSVLDIGCAIGTDLRRFRSAIGSGNFVGVDIMQALVEAAKEDNPEDKFLQGSVLSLPLNDNEIDFVHVERVFIHVKELEVGIREIIRVMKPGATCFITEVDFRTSVIHSKDETVVKVLSLLEKTRINTCPSPFVASDLYRTLKTLENVENVTITGIPVVDLDTVKFDKDLTMTKQTLEKLVKDEQISPQERDVCIKAHQDGPKTGELFISYMLFRISFQKK